jgi:hypothetical protein
MMQKSICTFCLALCMICLVPRGYAQKGKSEVTVGYGFYSFYQFVNAGLHYNTHYSNSSGTTVIGYRYYVSRNVTLGMGLGYENIGEWGSFLTFAPEVTVAYLDTRQDQVRVKLYGAVSYGISVFNDAQTGYGHTDESGPKAWAFQATPFGIRIGRQFAFFAEVGLGYKGLISGGLAVRFPRLSAAHRQQILDEANN